MVAVFLETIQGEGGINPTRTWTTCASASPVRRQRNWLLMIDEVQCGIGRTGKRFAHQWAGIVPDVMPLAKGLGSGVPIGAIVAGPRPRGDVFQAPTTAPPSAATRWRCAPASNLRIMEEDGLLANAAAPALAKAGLEARTRRRARRVEIRGQA